MLFCLRGLRPNIAWNERSSDQLLGVQHRLCGMALLTLLPIGLIQLTAAIDHGYWYARSASSCRSRSSSCWYGCACPAIRSSASGALALAWFVLRLWVRRRGACNAARRDAAGRTMRAELRLLAAAPHRLLFFVRREQRAARDDLVGNMVDRCSLARHRHVAAGGSGGLAARDHHAVPGTAGLMFGFLLTVFPR
jgi:hypothetical protein